MNCSVESVGQLRLFTDMQMAGMRMKSWRMCRDLWKKAIIIFESRWERMAAMAFLKELIMILLSILQE